MWSPPDKSTLPTLEELKRAKEAIYLVQRDLESATVALAQAQLRVDTLKKDLEERNAWIAPVRKLTFDVLSMIFEWCGEIEWDSPVRIVAVCRTWRSAALATPRAWSFAESTSQMTFDLFFERSRERHLHVYRQWSTYFELSHVAHRICCLSLDRLWSIPRTLVFPNLKRLSIFRGDQIGIADVNTRRFPALLHLGTGVTTFHHQNDLVDKETFFPQLESWSLCISPSRAWLNGFRSCWRTLVSLEVFIPSDSVLDHQPLVLLPVLRGLVINTPAPKRQGILNLKTPMLETYEEYCRAKQGVPKGPIHVDVGTVLQMRVVVEGLLRLSLSYFPGLQKLQIYGRKTGVLSSILTQLSANDGICPALQSIEFLMDDLDDDFSADLKSLSEINRGRALPIQVISSLEWDSLPGSIVTSCGDDMPCTEKS